MISCHVTIWLAHQSIQATDQSWHDLAPHSGVVGFVSGTFPLYPCLLPIGACGEAVPVLPSPPFASGVQNMRTIKTSYPGLDSSAASLPL